MSASAPSFASVTSPLPKPTSYNHSVFAGTLQSIASVDLKQFRPPLLILVSLLFLFATVLSYPRIESDSLRWAGL